MKKHKEFSKQLLLQESALIWIMSLSFIVLAFYCIGKGFTGSLPWLAAMVGCPWAAYAVSQGFYYKKAEKENSCGGIKFEAALADMKKVASQYEDSAAFDVDFDFPLDNDDKYKI